MRWVWLFLGGGLGAALRFAVALWVDARLPSPFPWGTLTVNGLGCLGIGILATLADEAELISPLARLFLVSGLLGGFTTFSTFGMETWQLIEARNLGLAVAYATASVIVGMLGVVTGVVATRSVL
jgi:CrcB protein